MTNKFAPHNRLPRNRESDTLCSTVGCTNFCMLSANHSEESLKCGVCMALQMLSNRVADLENQLRSHTATVDRPLIGHTAVVVSTK